MNASPSRKRKAAVIVGLTLFAGLGVAALRVRGPFFGRGDGRTKLGRVTKSELIQRVTVPGTVVPRRRTVITPPFNGYVQKLYVRIGEKVPSGAPLVSVVQSLLAKGEVYPLRAPFAGTVVQVIAAEGQYVREGGDDATMLRIDDLGLLYVNSDVPELDIGKIRIGQEVVIKASAVPSRSYKGVIREMSLAAREKKEWSRSNDRVEFPVRIEITDQDGKIHPGMSVLIDIIAEKKTGVLTLRHEFIQKSGEQYFVTLREGERRNIAVGLQNEEMFEIVTGLRENDEVRQADFLSMAAED